MGDAHPTAIFPRSQAPAWERVIEALPLVANGARSEIKEVLDEQMMERISVNRKIRFGKPCIAGTRITVQDVLELLDAGLSFCRHYARLLSGYSS